jgi:hypothetical protein
MKWWAGGVPCPWRITVSPRIPIACWGSVNSGLLDTIRRGGMGGWQIGHGGQSRTIPVRKVGKVSDDWDSEKSGSNTGAALIQDDEIEESVRDPVPHLCPKYSHYHSHCRVPKSLQTPSRVLPLTKWHLSISRAMQVGNRLALSTTYVHTRSLINSLISFLTARRVWSLVLLVFLVHCRPERLRQIQHNWRVIVRF